MFLATLPKYDLSHLASPYNTIGQINLQQFMPETT